MSHCLDTDQDQMKRGAARRTPVAAARRMVETRPETRWLFAALAGLTVVVWAFAAHSRAAPESFAPLAEKLLPSVVNISTTQTIDMADRGGQLPQLPQFPPGSPFEDFFKDFFNRHGGGNGNGDGMPQKRKATALGSGFIIDSSGYIVTNNHVIADADEITVILQDDTALKAELIGKDSKTDVALLKVDAKRPLPAVAWGDSDQTRVGDWVIAIGNPFGLGGSVTAGIVSARSRDISSGPYDDFIQTDASINRGNSGGPLFNMDGEVVGINTAIYSPPGAAGGSVGIGFSTASNLARSVIADLRKFGKTRRGWLGVHIQSVTPEIADSLGLDQPYGALIASVAEGGPAAKGGIQQGDIVLEFNGRRIDEMRRLPRIVAETEIGKSVSVKLWRDGKVKMMMVSVGELDETEAAAAEADPQNQPPPAPPPAKTVSVLGMELSELNDEGRQRFNLSPEVAGVLVQDLDPNGEAAEKGVRPGDVVLEVGQKNVTRPEEFKAQIEAAKKSGRRSVLLLVESEGNRRFLALKVE